MTDDRNQQNQNNGQGADLGAEDVQGMDAYDNSYSGGSSAMPSAGGSAAPPEATMNSNLDPALAGSDFDEQAMGQAVDSHQDKQEGEDRGKSG